MPKERYSAYPQFTSVEAAFFIRDVAGGNNVSGREEKQLDEQGGTLRAPRSVTEGRNRACVRDVRWSQDSTRLKLGHSSDVVSCRGRARPTTGCGPKPALRLLYQIKFYWDTLTSIAVYFMAVFVLTWPC